MSRTPDNLILRVERSVRETELVEEGVLPIRPERTWIVRGNTPYADSHTHTTRQFYNPSDVKYSGSYNLRQCPYKEEEVKVGSSNYHKRAVKNCYRYIKTLRRLFGPEPFGATFVIISTPVPLLNERKTGYLYEKSYTYHVRVLYCKEEPAAKEYADRITIRQPNRWRNE